MITASRELNCQDEKAKMTQSQYDRFYPFRSSITESKAFMRAIRSALGLAATYTMDELKKPFIVAHVVPNFDAPEIRDAAAANFLQASGLLFETTRQTITTTKPTMIETVADTDPEPEPLPEPEPEPSHAPEEQAVIDTECSECGKKITEKIARYSVEKYGRELCMNCQKKVK